MFLLHSIADHFYFLKINSFPIVEARILILEGPIISNYPYSPSAGPSFEQPPHRPLLGRLGGNTRPLPPRHGWHACLGKAQCYWWRRTSPHASRGEGPKICSDVPWLVGGWFGSGPSGSWASGCSAARQARLCPPIGSGLWRPGGKIPFDVSGRILVYFFY
jgi:hypothetical protein